MPSTQQVAELPEGHDGDTMQRGLAIEKDDIPVLQMALHSEADLQMCVCMYVCVCTSVYVCEMSHTQAQLHTCNNNVQVQRYAGACNKIHVCAHV